MLSQGVLSSNNNDNDNDNNNNNDNNEEENTLCNVTQKHMRIT